MVLNQVSKCDVKWYHGGGFVGVDIVDGIAYIYAFQKDNKFTIGMMRDIMLLSKRIQICFILDTPSRQKLIRRALDKHGVLEYIQVEDIIFAYYEGSLK